MTAVLAAPTEPVRERRQVALGQYDPYDNTPYDKKPNKKPNQYGDQQNDNQYGQENNGYQQPQHQQQQVPSWVGAIRWEYRLFSGDSWVSTYFGERLGMIFDRK